MNRNNLILISRTFYPIEGGIQTYMLEIAKKWNGKVKVFCKKEDNIPEHSTDPLDISRFNFGKTTYFKSVLIIFSFLRLVPWGNKIAYLIFCSVLFTSRFSTIEIASFANKMINSIKEEEEPDFLFSSVPLYVGLIGIIIKLIFGTKLVTFIHGKELLVINKKNTSNLMKLVFKYSDLVVSNSQYTKELALKFNIDENVVKVVNLGANTNLFLPVPKPIEYMIKKQINPNSKILLTLSHLVPRKGQDQVIRALSKVILQHPNTKYVIAGQGDNLTQLKKIVRDNQLSEDVIFLGFVPDDQLNLLMNCCDIFIMPNRQEDGDVEGYGIVFMEANACKKPVIGGNSGGVPDAIMDGKTGYLVDPLDIDDIALKISALLSNQRLADRMGQNGYERVVNELNWDKVANKVHGLVREI